MSQQKYKFSSISFTTSLRSAVHLIPLLPHSPIPLFIYSPVPPLPHIPYSIHHCSIKHLFTCPQYYLPSSSNSSQVKLPHFMHPLYCPPLFSSLYLNCSLIPHSPI